MSLPVVLIRGAGDLASGVALRLYRAGFRLLMTEVDSPMAVRRTVCFSEAVFTGETQVEGVISTLKTDLAAAKKTILAGQIPILIDPELTIHQLPGAPLYFPVVVDARLLKKKVQPITAALVIGLGPGFSPGENCHAIVETMRGHLLGRVYMDRPALKNTGLPDGNPARVVRATTDGVIEPKYEIADHVQAGDIIAVIKNEIGEEQIAAQVSGVLRGVLRKGMHVRKGLKIGDIDERGDPSFCSLVSDKSNAIGGGVLEAILANHKTLPDLYR